MGINALNTGSERTSPSMRRWLPAVLAIALSVAASCRQTLAESEMPCAGPIVMFGDSIDYRTIVREEVGNGHNGVGLDEVRIEEVGSVTILRNRGSANGMGDTTPIAAYSGLPPPVFNPRTGFWETTGFVRLTGSIVPDQLVTLRSRSSKKSQRTGIEHSDEMEEMGFRR